MIQYNSFLRKFTFTLLILACFNTSFGKKLVPGFDPNEYAEMLRITTRQRGPIPDSLYPNSIRYSLTYSSPSFGMDNGWQLWLSKDSQAVLSLRATTMEKSSWLEDFYCAMSPAMGNLHIEDDFIFSYHLAANPRASVHTGWLIGMAYLQRDILPKIDSIYSQGFRDIIILGHSQGGAISYLMTSHLYYLQSTGRIPPDIRFKTYSSASPKPGNLFYAYDYENLTKGDWAFNVINSADWVPETPMSIQTGSDYSTVNPWSKFNDATQGVSWPARAILRGKYNGLLRNLDRSNNKLNKLLGKEMTRLVKIYCPEFQPPKSFEFNNYQRAGNQITLLANDAYCKKFPKDKDEVFRHHLMDAYEYLLELHYGDQMEPQYIIYLNK